MWPLFLQLYFFYFVHYLRLFFPGKRGLDDEPFDAGIVCGLLFLLHRLHRLSFLPSFEFQSVELLINVVNSMDDLSIVGYTLMVTYNILPVFTHRFLSFNSCSKLLLVVIDIGNVPFDYPLLTTFIENKKMPGFPAPSLAGGSFSLTPILGSFVQLL